MTDSSQASYEAVERHEPFDDDTSRMQCCAKPLDKSRLQTILYLLFDLLVASLALLFTTFGICVYVHNGKPAVSGSMGLKLFEVAKYVSIVSHLPAANLSG